MTDEVAVSPDDMANGIKSVTKMADAYKDSIDVLEEVVDLAGGVFEGIDNSPQKSWEAYRDAIWECLADSQDIINRSAKNLADYTTETFDIDKDTAKAINDAADYSDADRPEGD